MQTRRGRWTATGRRPMHFTTAPHTGLARTTDGGWWQWSAGRTDTDTDTAMRSTAQHSTELLVIAVRSLYNTQHGLHGQNLVQQAVTQSCWAARTTHSSQKSPPAARTANRVGSVRQSETCKKGGGLRT